uniref:Transmembrane protein n=1 Tax=Opuntia streptacantha TaxID=393608 RepID=A0A7C8Z751_OPUST
MKYMRDLHMFKPLPSLFRPTFIAHRPFRPLPENPSQVFASSSVLSASSSVPSASPKESSAKSHCPTAGAPLRYASLPPIFFFFPLLFFFTISSISGDFPTRFGPSVAGFFFSPFLLHRRRSSLFFWCSGPFAPLSVPLFWCSHRSFCAVFSLSALFIYFWSGWVGSALLSLLLQ